MADRTKTTTYLTTHFPIHETIRILRRTDDLDSLGFAIGWLRTLIGHMVSNNMDHAADFRNKPSSVATKGLTFRTDEFTSAVDEQLRYLRSKDRCFEKFPDDSGTNRKGRRTRRKYGERCTSILQSWYREVLHMYMRGWMQTWNAAQNGEFNKGVEKGLRGITNEGYTWRRYPVKNVCLEAGDEDWKEWLNVRCDKLGMDESTAGRIAFGRPPQPGTSVQRRVHFLEPDRS